MTKTTEAIIILVLMLISFFVGVNYSDSVKSHMGWIFESNEADVELPDLSEDATEIDIIDEAGSDVGVVETSPKTSESNFSDSEVNSRSEASEPVQP